jgi:hypothetical protein
MAKKYTVRAGTGMLIVKTSESGRWVVRSSKGDVKVHTLSKKSKKTIKSATKKFAPALSRLAYR